MQLWKIILTYDGTPYHGWQIQPGLPSIQGALAEAVRHVTGEQVLPQGSGRTDTGVHALGQVATFSLECAIPPANLMRALNRALPPSIRVLRVEAAEAGFHARHSAVRKSYEYRIFPGVTKKGIAGRVCSPMMAPYVWDCPLPLELGAMQEAAGLIVGTHDFSSFAAVDPDRATREAEAEPPAHATNIRTIHHSSWQERGGLYCYQVTGSGFLHHMVRNLVGTFVEAATGRIAASAVADILAARSRSAAGPTAPASGLFLVEVTY